MNKLALLVVLMLPACASPGENARLAQAALDHDRAVCVARGDQPGTDDYTRCMVKLGHREGYRVAKADDDQLVFKLAGGAGGMGPAGGGTFYPGVYVPPLGNNPN